MLFCIARAATKTSGVKISFVLMRLPSRYLALYLHILYEC